MIKLHITFLFIVILRIEPMIFSMLNEGAPTQLIIQPYVFLYLCHRGKGALLLITPFALLMVIICSSFIHSSGLC